MRAPGRSRSRRGWPARPHLDPCRNGLRCSILMTAYRWRVKGVKATFAHDTEVALACAADLVNTAEDAPDRLATPDDLDAFVERWEWTGDRTRDQAELDAVRALRPVLRRVWLVDEDEAVRIVNG